MVENEKELDIIEKAHVAAERLERANKVKEQLLAREEELQKRAEGIVLLGGQSYAGGQQPPKVLTEEEKLKIDGKLFFKGGMLEKVFE